MRDDPAKPEHNQGSNYKLRGDVERPDSSFPVRCVYYTSINLIQFNPFERVPRSKVPRGRGLVRTHSKSSDAALPRSLRSDVSTPSLCFPFPSAKKRRSDLAICLVRSLLFLALLWQCQPHPQTNGKGTKGLDELDTFLMLIVISPTTLWKTACIVPDCPEIFVISPAVI